MSQNKTISPDTSKPSRNQRPGRSIFTRDLTPSEIESLRNDKKQALEQAEAYFKKKYPPDK